MERIVMKSSEALKILKREIKWWSYMVKHYGWKVTTMYYDSKEDMPDGAGEKCVGYTVCDFKYLEATIHINLKMASCLSEDELEYVAAHELVHLLVSPLVESSDTTPHEYTVTTIARILCGLRNANKKAP